MALKPLLVWTLAIPNIAKGVINFRKVKITGKRVVAERLRAMQNQEKLRTNMLGKMLSIAWARGEKYDWSVEDVQQECMVAM
jgi:hypothetical protein